MVSEATNDGILRMRYILELLGKSSQRQHEGSQVLVLGTWKRSYEVTGGGGPTGKLLWDLLSPGEKKTFLGVG